MPTLLFRNADGSFRCRLEGDARPIFSFLDPVAIQWLKAEEPSFVEVPVREYERVAALGRNPRYWFYVERKK